MTRDEGRNKKDVIGKRNKKEASDIIWRFI